MATFAKPTQPEESADSTKHTSDYLGFGAYITDDGRLTTKNGTPIPRTLFSGNRGKLVDRKMPARSDAWRLSNLIHTSTIAKSYQETSGVIHHNWDDIKKSRQLVADALYTLHRKDKQSSATMCKWATSVIFSDKMVMFVRFGNHTHNILCLRRDLSSYTFEYWTPFIDKSLMMEKMEALMN